jgi:pyridoxine kinase
MLEKLMALGCKNVILTGVSYRPGYTGIVVLENGEQRYYEHELLPNSCHGTGDIYASAFVGALVRGKDALTAAKIAADYTVKCIINTQGDADHWYGAKFETALGDLMNMLK